MLASPDGVLARLAAPELQAAPVPAVKVLRGGTDAGRLPEPSPTSSVRYLKNPVNLFQAATSEDGRPEGEITEEAVVAGTSGKADGWP